MQIDIFKKHLSFVLRKVVFNPQVVFSSILISYFLLYVLLVRQNSHGIEHVHQFPMQALWYFIEGLLCIYILSAIYFIGVCAKVVEKALSYWREGRYMPLLFSMLELSKILFLYFLPLFFIKNMSLMAGVTQKTGLLLLVLIVMHALFKRMPVASQKEAVSCEA